MHQTHGQSGCITSKCAGVLQVFSPGKNFDTSLTIAIAEYAAGDDPLHLSIQNLQVETFDFRDATAAGSLHAYLLGEKTNIEGYNRRIVANDVKILAQIKTRSIASIIIKDVASYSRYVGPLLNAGLLNLTFLDINTPANEALGQLFPF